MTDDDSPPSVKTHRQRQKEREVRYLTVISRILFVLIVLLMGLTSTAVLASP